MAQKQSEFQETPSPAIRNSILQALEIKEEIGEKHGKLKEALDSVRKMMREDKKKVLTVQDEDGRDVTIRLVPTGEKVTFSVEKEKKKLTA